MTAVAIDGPAGAGKSTIARAVSEKLGFIYVDTGAIYRTVALYLLNYGISADDSDRVEKALKKIEVDIMFESGVQQMILNGANVSDLIRKPEVSMMASKSSAIPCVRAFLLEKQRSFAVSHNVIMDGRDIGTVVLPDAKIKIFLTASAECRAKRRFDELIAKGEKVDYNDVLTDMKQRDYQDTHRKTAPLKPAVDSIMVDTSDMNLQQSIDYLTNLIKSKMD